MKKDNKMDDKKKKEKKIQNTFACGLNIVKHF